MENDYGIIYVFTNEWMPGLVKIGKTTRKEINKRLRDLYYGATGVPCNFECAHAYRVPVEKLNEYERSIHSYFEKQGKRINKDREFFNITPQEVDDVFKLLKIGGSVFDDEVKTEMKAELEKVTQEEAKRTRRKNMDFFELGLRVGDTLAYTRDHNITCTIASNRSVNFAGRLGVSLSSITKELVGYPVQPSMFWLANGVPLITIQNQAYAESVAESANKAMKKADELITKCKHLKEQI